MATDKNTIKSWFEKDDRPTQAQFWAWIDSIWHKDEKIPITAINDIETILNEKADAEALTNHVDDENAHAALFAEPTARIAALEAKTDSENNWKTITGYSLNPDTRVLTMDAGWEGIINGIEYTNVAAQEMLPAIPLANSGYSRIDLIVFKTDGIFERIPGVESTFTPVAPPKPAYTLEATFLTVGDGVVNAPVIPKPKAPVTSVNGMRGDVVLAAINDLVTGGIYDFLSAEQGKILKTQIDNINTLLASDNVNLDNVQELVDAIETVQTSLSTILVNDLTTGGTTKALTAEMGKTLKALIDGLTTNKVDKVAGERLINAGEITKLAGLGSLSTTVKPILSTALGTQNVAGFVTYINALTPVLVVGASEIVKYNLTDTGRVFELNLRGRSFGVGQPAIVAADVLEVTEFLNKDLKLSNYPSTRNDGPLPSNRVAGFDIDGNLKNYTINTSPTSADLVSNNVELDLLSANHAASPLITPTFDGSGQAIHPSVIFIKNGLSGYKYWMAMTPFTNGNDGVETPSVLVSNDRITWVVPAGVTNPLVTQETLPIYTYDTEIIQGLDGKLYIYYGKNNPTIGKNFTYVISSVDGITWSLPIEILQYTNPNFALSPTVIIENGLYAMYYVDNSSSSRKLVKITSSLPDSGWNTSSIVTCPISNLPAGKSIWHLSIRKYYNEYHCLATLSDTSGTWQNSILYLMDSSDGTNFKCSSNVLLDKTAGTWYSQKVYRSTFVLLNNNKYALWYSAQSTDNTWHTGYTECFLDNIIRKETDSPEKVFNLWSGTQAQYDALTLKKSTTLYFIT